VVIENTVNTSGHCFTLEQDMTVHFTRGAFDTKDLAKLSKGTYCLDLVSPQGSFYLGPERNIWSPGASGMYLIFHGGFFVPKNSDVAVKWWYKRESTRVYKKDGKEFRMEIDNLLGLPKPGIVLSQALSPIQSRQIRTLARNSL
jgi:hypothetical protein